MKRVQAQAFARAGLLGNPSDGYEGKAIAVVVRNFSATVVLEEADRFEIVPGPADALAFDDFSQAADRLRLEGCYGGVRLLRAAMRRFAQFAEKSGLPADALARDGRFRISYDSDIPRQVGMSGSSAIVVAALRGLLQWYGASMEPWVLAETALAAEVEDLGIAAGPMDRAIQSYEGALLMDFKQPRGPHSYRRLDPAILPPLYIAYDPSVGEVSGKVHSDVKFRWLRGDPDVREAIAVFPRLVDEGIVLLEKGDIRGFMKLVDLNFDTRARIWTLSERDHEMVRIGRGVGAAVKFCGSGGAVVGAMPEEAMRPAIEAAYAKAGYATIRPKIAP